MASPPQTSQGLSVRVGSVANADPEPIGGPITVEHTDELALGAPDDYGVDDMIALGEDDGEGPVFGLTFGERDDTTSWDVHEIQELVVNETRGQFESDASGRNDAMVMEEGWDAEDDVVVAVWAPDKPGGKARLGPRIRRRRSYAHLLPYGLIAAGLGAAAVVGMVGFAALVLVTLLASNTVVQRPLDPSQIPVSDYERQEIVPQTPEQILEEVLGDEAKR